MADFDKIIHRQKPYRGANGQYNFNTEYGTIMDTSIKGNRELFSLSEGTYLNELGISTYPGFMWPWKGLKLTINEIFLNNRQNYDTVDGKLYVHIFDEDVSPFIADEEDGGIIDGYCNNENKLFGPLRWNEGCHNHDSGEGDVCFGDNNFGIEHGTCSTREGIEHWDGCDCCGDHSTGGTWSELSINNINRPSEIELGSSVCNQFNPTQVFSDDMQNFSDKVQRIGDDSNIWIVIKMHGNAEETGYCNKDRRNRSFQKFKIPKKYFYDLMTNRGIPSVTLKWGNPGWLITAKPGYRDKDNNFVSGSYTKNDVSPTYTFPLPPTRQDNHGTESDEGGWFGDDKKSAAYEVDGLVITLSGLDDEAYLLENYPSNLDSTYVNVASQPEFINLNPNTDINYMSFFSTGSLEYGVNEMPFYTDSDASFLSRRSDVLQFRPISYVSVSESWDYDLQSFYEYGDDYVYTTAPNIIDLTFRIAEDSAAWFPDYLDGYTKQTGLDYIEINDSILKNQRFMFFVTDWNAINTDIDWVDIMQNFPQTYTELLLMQEEGTHDIVDLFYYYDSNHNNWTEGDTEGWRYNFASHEYTTPGIKIIKAIVFSYIRNPNKVFNAGNDWIQTLRWKAVTIKINLNSDNAYVEDFSDLGGNDYTYIPWPETSPIIGGISRTSQYVQSTKSLVKDNFFSEHEIVREGQSLQAYANTPGQYLDELGDHLGKVDLAQFRYFTEPYDMNDLLMLPELRNTLNCSDTFGECEEGVYPGQMRPGDNLLICGGDGYYHKYHGGFCDYSPEGTDCPDGGSCMVTGQTFVNYNEYNKFYDLENEVGGFAENPTYPEGTCVGTLFISNNSNTPLMESCISELNFDYIDGITVQDSSGNDNRGIVIGDYKVSKAGFDKPITREDPSELPAVNVEDLSF
tara:strand:+ start:8882 stop:11605 length:2724 start_codon:yes stop_codon:yes gene_type:complete